MSAIIVPLHIYIYKVAFPEDRNFILNLFSRKYHVTNGSLCISLLCNHSESNIPTFYQCSFSAGASAELALILFFRRPVWFSISTEPNWSQSTSQHMLPFWGEGDTWGRGLQHVASKLYKNFGSLKFYGWSARPWKNTLLFSAYQWPSIYLL